MKYFLVGLDFESAGEDVEVSYIASAKNITKLNKGLNEQFNFDEDGRVMTNEGNCFKLVCIRELTIMEASILDKHLPKLVYT